MPHWWLKFNFAPFPRAAVAVAVTVVPPAAIQSVTILIAFASFPATLGYLQTDEFHVQFDSAMLGSVSLRATAFATFSCHFCYSRSRGPPLRVRTKLNTAFCFACVSLPPTHWLKDHVTWQPRVFSQWEPSSRSVCLPIGEEDNCPFEGRRGTIHLEQT